MSLKVAITEAKTFTELKSVVEDTSLGLTFFGHQFIWTPRYKGTVTNDFLASKVIELINQYNFKFTRNERWNGWYISDRISILYRDSDKLVKRQNFLTSFFVFLRNLLNYRPFFCGENCCSTIRRYWMYNGNNSYENVMPRFYPRNQYYWVCHFGRTPHETLRFEHPEPEKKHLKVDSYWWSDRP